MSINRKVKPGFRTHEVLQNVWGRRGATYEARTSPKGKKNLSHTRGSSKAPYEMELELQLTAVGLQPTAVGLQLWAVGLCNGGGDRPLSKKRKISLSLGDVLYEALGP